MKKQPKQVGSSEEIGSEESRLRELQKLEQELTIARLNNQRLQDNLYHAYQGVQARDKTIEELKSSLSFRLGWWLTAPMRWVYDRLVGVADHQSADTTTEDREQQFSSQNIQNTITRAWESPLENRLAFRNEFSAYLEQDSAQKSISNVRPCLLLVVPHLPEFDQSSGEKRIFRLLQLLAPQFHLLLYTKAPGKSPYQEALEAIPAQIINTHDPAKIRKTIPQLDAIVFCWYYTLFESYELINLFPEARIVVDSVDVHWLREERSLGIDEKLTRSIVDQNKEKEILAYKAADVVWTVTENDRREILEEIPGKEIHIVSNIHELETDAYHPFKQPQILFFGGYRHQPNISAVQLLAKSILPLIRKHIGDVQLIIAGSKAPDEVKDLQELPGIRFIGFVPEEDVPALYRSAALTIVPLLAGAGIKGKICEAIAYRLPVLTNTVGNEGINLKHEAEGFLAETPEGMAKTAVRILTGAYDLESITERATQKLLHLVGPEAVKRNVLQSLFPTVSICIVTWNRLALLQACLDSILKNTVYPNYRILVHSNGCTDGTQEYLEQLAEQHDQIEAILSKTNDVFVLPNNRMMERYPDTDAVLLNNDVEVTRGWLLALQRAAYLSDSVGISGSKILYPDGTLQEFGSELYANGTGRNIGKWQDPQQPEYNQLALAGYVSGCAMYIKRSTIEKIGTFDEQFHPCYCEDSDYCYTAREQGLYTVVTPDSIVYHHEGATSGTDTESGFKAYQKVNMEKFLAKHRGKDNGIDWGE